MKPKEEPWNLKRVLRVAAGVVLIIVGLILMLPFVPGPGSLIVIAGIFLIAPKLGHRIVWEIKQSYRWFKQQFYGMKFKRVIRRKDWLKKVRAARKKISQNITRAVEEHRNKKGRKKVVKVSPKKNSKK